MVKHFPDGDVVLHEDKESAQLGAGVGMVVGPDGAISYWLPEPTGGYVTLHSSPSVGSPSNTWCMGVYHIPTGGIIPRRRYGRTRCYYTVFGGEAELTLNGKVHRFGYGDAVYVERNNDISFKSVGHDDLQLLWQSWYTGPDLFIEECGIKRNKGETGKPKEVIFANEKTAKWNNEADWWVGPIGNPDALHDVSNEFSGKPGQVLILRKDEGSSNWSPGEDMQGYITQKISPFNTAQHEFGVHWQYLHTGMKIPPHTHSRNEEMLFVLSGTGYAEFGGNVRVPIRAGSAVCVGRHVLHSLVCDSNSSMDVQFTITPPSLDVFFTDMGIPRNPDEPQRDAFPISEEAMPSLVRSWIPIEGGESDSDSDSRLG